MKVKMLRNSVAGGVSVFEGQIVNVSDKDGRALISMNKAKPVEVVEKAEAKEVQTAERVAVAKAAADAEKAAAKAAADAEKAKTE